MAALWLSNDYSCYQFDLVNIKPNQVSFEASLKPYISSLLQEKTNLEPLFSIVVHEFFKGGRAIHFLLLLPTFI